MKRTLTRRMLFEGRVLNFTFEYWPAYPATLTQPEESAEINILNITDLYGNSVQVSSCEDDGGDGSYEKIVQLLFTILEEETEYQNTTIAVEPWD